MDHRSEHRERYWSKRSRSDYICPDCGRGFDEVIEFQVHHIDGNILNGEDENLVALCKECHHDRHGEWTSDHTHVGRHRRDKKYVGYTDV